MTSSEHENDADLDTDLDTDRDTDGAQSPDTKKPRRRRSRGNPAAKGLPNGPSKKTVALAGAAVLAVAALVVGTVVLTNRTDETPLVRGHAPALPEDLRVSHQMLGEHPWDPTTWTQGLDTDPLDENRLLVSAASPDGSVPSRTWFQSISSGTKSQVQSLPCYDSPRTVTDPAEPGSPITTDCVFAEGTTFAGNGSVIWQLTWTDGVAYQRAPGTLEVAGTAMYGSMADVDKAAVLGAGIVERAEEDASTRQGWGACAFAGDQHRPNGVMVTSDGTDALLMRDGTDFTAAEKAVKVRAGDVPVTGINELACGHAFGVDGVWANLYPSNQVAFIGLDDGQVRAWVDLSAMRAEQETERPQQGGVGPDRVANGVAIKSVSPESTVLYVTGKQWSTLYEIEVPTGAGSSTASSAPMGAKTGAAVGGALGAVTGQTGAAGAAIGAIIGAEGSNEPGN